MPPTYGTISKAFTQRPNAEDANTTLNIFVLSVDNNNKLTTASTTLKNNLKTYLNQYRMIGDSLSIRDAFVINIGVNFEIITLPNYNNNRVLGDCIIALQRYFNTNRWQINQPILLNPLYVLLDEVEGVQTVKTIKISNISGLSKGYSEWAYDINGATQNGTIFPSLDPSIFEVKFPNTDIKGQVVAI
jgi:phage-related baseplate assembly protein